VLPDRIAPNFPKAFFDAAEGGHFSAAQRKFLALWPLHFLKIDFA